MDNLTFFWIIGVLLVLVGLAGVVLPGLPGAIIIFGGLFLAAWAEGFSYVGTGTIVVLALLTGFIYTIDIIAGYFGVKKFGASKWAAVGAALGALVGIFFGLPGILAGPFIGAVIGELSAHGNFSKAGKAGFGAWFGIIFGTAIKLALSFTMIGIFVISRFF